MTVKVGNQPLMDICELRLSGIEMLLRDANIITTVGRQLEIVVIQKKEWMWMLICVMKIMMPLKMRMKL